MAKNKKYIVEKSELPSDFTGKHYYMIWINDHDVILNDEKTAQQICDALNIAEQVKSIKRKAKTLYGELSIFIEEE